MWIVLLLEYNKPYGPFTDEEEANKFADFVTNEVDPAVVLGLGSPTTELLSWYSAEMDK